MCNRVSAGFSELLSMCLEVLFESISEDNFIFWALHHFQQRINLRQADFFFWKSCQNGILRAQRKYLKVKAFSLKKLKLFFFFGISGEKIGVLVEKFRQGCQNWFLRNGGTFWRINLIQTEPFFYRFRTSSKVFRTFSEAIQAGLSEMHLTVPIDPFGEA